MSEPVEPLQLAISAPQRAPGSALNDAPILDGEHDYRGNGNEQP
jgi:hypothetical protein